MPLNRALDLVQLEMHSKSSHNLVRAYVEAINSYIGRADKHALANQDKENQGQVSEEAIAFGYSLVGRFLALLKHYLDDMPMAPFLAGNTPFAAPLMMALIACWARLLAFLTDRVENEHGGNVRTM